METTLNAEPRSERGKNLARRLRRGGRIPGVVYGEGGGSGEAGALAVSVEPEEVSRVLHSEAGANTLIGLTVGTGDSSKVLIKDYQVDPISHQLLHVDFYRVAMDRVITVTVPIELTGEAEGVKVQGGLIDFVQREVAIACLPSEIPEHIQVDVSPLMIGQGVRLRELLEGASWEPVSDPDTLIVHVIAPRLEAEDEDEGEDAAEGEAEDEAASKAEG
ncbi:MAG: 50S ribosomal protein L25 [Acidobacteria bacterium]|nr:50S ribosomal protein L25 [Acidobacteriota bacterium]